MSVIEHIIPSQSHGIRNGRYGAVAIGASAGGVRAVGDVLAALPADFPLPILLVLHLSRTMPSHLVEVLRFRTALGISWARPGEKALPGKVHVAPRNRHLLLQANGRLALCDAAPVDWWRPAVDRLFESAAASLGPRAIGVVLSGALYDGMRGTAAIRRAGGLAIAQCEKGCDHFDMPAAAIDWGGADIILPPAKIAEALIVAARLDLPEAA
jgi:two-component system, chemotaxis family, protein-glutamate methylesterase/glutaminase